MDIDVNKHERVSNMSPRHKRTMLSLSFYILQSQRVFNNKFVCLMVFNDTFNNISVISWQSVLLVGETGGPGENHRPVASHSTIRITRTLK
jgi:hypothetical protein